MKLSLVIFTALIGLNVCCSESTESLPCFLVDARSSDSDCVSFLSFGQALVAALLLPKASVVLGPLSIEFSESVTIANEVDIVGAPTQLTVSGRLNITGKLSLVAVLLRQAGVGAALFECVSGTLFIASSEIAEGDRVIAELLSAAVEVRDSSMRNLTAAVFVLRTTDCRLVLANTQLSDIETVVVVATSLDEGSGEIELRNTTIERLGRLFLCAASVAARLTVTIENCTALHAHSELFSGRLAGVAVDARNLTIADSQQVMLGSLLNSSLSFAHCSFLRMSGRLFDLSALQGDLLLTDSTIRNVSSGPLVLIPANTFPPVEARISIRNCWIVNVTNLEGSGLCSVLVGHSVSFSLIDTDISNTDVVEGGLFKLSAGWGQLVNVNYHDSAAQMYSFFEGVAVFLALTNVLVQRVANDDVMISMCILEGDCRLTNVTIVESLNRKNRIQALVLFGTGYSAFGIVRNSFFHNYGFCLLSMGSNDGGVLYILDSIFVDLTSRLAFTSLKDASISIENVTFIRPSVDVFFRGYYCEHCFNLSRISIDGESQISNVVWIENGGLSLSDSTFSGVSTSLFRISDADLLVQSVTYRNSPGRVCGECLDSRIQLLNFSIEGIHTPQVFEMTYCTVSAQQWMVRNVTCEQLLVIDECEVSVLQGNLQELTVSTFGGLVYATSSSILISDTRIAQVSSTLSIRIGLLYLDASSLRIHSSSFRRFNSTLICSEHSPVSITDSIFEEGGLEPAAHSQGTKMDGSVLWGASVEQVTISNCSFSLLSASNGGVIHLTGSGSEVCAIDNCTGTFNSALQRGGFLYADRVQLTLRGCSLLHNTAVQGGALWISGSSGESLANLHDTQFADNYARLDGGALLHIHCQFQDVNCEWRNNTAEYGPSVASELASFAVLDERTLTPVEGIIEAVSGQQHTAKVLVGCVDSLKQVMRTDNFSVLTLFTTEEHASIAVPTLLQAVRGVFTLPSMIVIGSPGSVVSVYGSLKNNFTGLIFSVTLRECVAGEYSNEMQCKLCTHNTYSLQPSDPCVLCPPEADCPAGESLVLHPGFWRPSTHTADIYTCIVPELCIGGFESNCAPGHTGTMCSKCREGYFKVNQMQCVSCENRAVAALRGVLGLAVAALTAVYAVRVGEVMTHLVVCDFFQTMRILLNFNLYWPSAVAFLYTAIGDIGAAGLTAFSDPCLWTVLTLETLYVQLLVTCSYLAVLSLTAALAFALCKLCRSTAVPKFVLYVTYLSWPMALLRVMGALPCYEVGTAQFLIYDSSVECWSGKHSAYVLSLCLPVLILTGATLIAFFAAAKGCCKQMEKWRGFCLGIFLLRKSALIVCLLFSTELTLATQVSCVILFNLTAELVLYCRADCRDEQFFVLYQSTLASTTLLAFFCVIYWASTSDITDKEPLFTIVNYVCVCLPAVYVTLRIIIARLRRPTVYLRRINNSVSEDSQQVGTHGVPPASVESVQALDLDYSGYIVDNRLEASPI